MQLLKGHGACMHAWYVCMVGCTYVWRTARTSNTSCRAPLPPSCWRPATCTASPPGHSIAALAARATGIYLLATTSHFSATALLMRGAAWRARGGDVGCAGCARGLWEAGHVRMLSSLCNEHTTAAESQIETMYAGAEGPTRDGHLASPGSAAVYRGGPHTYTVARAAAVILIKK